ncbi:MAG: biotin/lipoyl-containing protein [Candidatus Eisenbacteria bacterium]
MGKSFTLYLDGVAYTIEQQGKAVLVNGKRFDPEISGAAVVLGDSKLNIEIGEGQVFIDGIAHLLATDGLDECPSGELAAVASVGAGDGALAAIMPGLIIKVPVSVGDAVAAGDVIVVLEAMKMENEICSPIDGVVKEIRVKPGDIVEQNQKLALIE